MLLPTVEVFLSLVSNTAHLSVINVKYCSPEKAKASLSLDFAGDCSIVLFSFFKQGDYFQSIDSHYMKS